MHDADNEEAETKGHSMNFLHVINSQIMRKLSQMPFEKKRKLSPIIWNIEEVKILSKNRIVLITLYLSVPFIGNVILELESSMDKLVGTNQFVSNSSE